MDSSGQLDGSRLRARVEWWVTRPPGFWEGYDVGALSRLQAELGWLGEEVDEHADAARRGYTIGYPDDLDLDDQWAELHDAHSIEWVAERLTDLYHDIHLAKCRAQARAARPHATATTARCRPPVVHARTAARPRERRERRARSCSSSSSGDDSRSSGDSDPDPPALGGPLIAARGRAAA